MTKTVKYTKFLSTEADLSTPFLAQALLQFGVKYTLYVSPEATAVAKEITRILPISVVMDEELTWDEWYLSNGTMAWGSPGAA